jgi:nanoRNase/pAp phosphatase (c-di-AMP/oligoRNAs hydrolase)
VSNAELAAERLDEVVAAFEGCERFLVQTHNNPDPDSIACALTLRYLIQRYTGKDAVIAFGGVVGRSENRAMVRQLNIPMVPGALIDYATYDFTAVCDTQPGTNYTSFPEGFLPTVVIDHHPAREEARRCRVCIIEPHYGATSTLIAEMLIAKRIPIPTDVATALYYGIKSETQDLARDTTDADIEVYRELEKSVDRRLVARIEAGRVPREYFREFITALHNAELWGTPVVTSDMGRVRVPDMVPEMADVLLRTEGSVWSCVVGEYRDTVHVSMRTNDLEADAGAVMEELLAGRGSGGGHPSMAGGQVSVESLPEEERQSARADLLERFAARVAPDAADRQALIPPLPENGDE